MSSRDLDRIERLARQIKSGKLPKSMKNPKSADKKDAIKAAKKFMKRADEYRKLTGKSRILRPEREALMSYTAKQVFKHRDDKRDSWLKRINSYQAKFGEPGIDELNDLRYADVATVARRYGAKPLARKKDEYVEWDDWLTFSEPEREVFGWYDLPGWVRRLGRKSNEFLYLNADILWGSGFIVPDSIPYLVSGSDVSVETFVKTVIGSPKGAGRYHMEARGKEIHIYDKTEWDLKSELSPDWWESGKYR